MTDSQPPPNDEASKAAKRLNRLSGGLRDNMVAYLDGECDEETARSIDETLASNEVARKEVDRLAKVYELLDQLPRPAASSDFTDATMQSVEAIKPVERDLAGDVKRQITPWLQVGKTLLLSFACTLGGLFVGQLAFARESDDLLRDLEAIEKLERYQAIGSPELMEWISKDSVQKRFREAGNG